MTAAAGPVKLNTTMNRQERIVLAFALLRSRQYLEFGAGYSTRLAHRLGVRRIVSVETDPNYINALRHTIGDSPRIDYVHGDVGPTGDWGVPVDDSHRAQWPNYTTAAWQRVSTLGVSPDLILIDGRFRVAAFASAVLNAAPGTRILIDDYAPRPNYHVAESVLPLRRMTGRIAHFRIPALLTHQQRTAAQSLFDSHVLDYN